MILDRVRKLLAPTRDEISVPEVRSTRDELVAEKIRRQFEHDRTDRLAKMLADYRRQDSHFRR